MSCLSDLKQQGFNSANYFFYTVIDPFICRLDFCYAAECVSHVQSIISIIF